MNKMKINKKMQMKNIKKQKKMKNQNLKNKKVLEYCKKTIIK